MNSTMLFVVIALAFCVGVSGAPSDAPAATAERNPTPASGPPDTAPTPEDDAATIQPRTFSPVQILNLPQPSCRYDSRRNGTCMQGTECVLAGGQFKADSACNPARGAYLATCCLLEQTCGGIIRKNNTYFVSPDFPNDTSEPQTCDVAVAPGLASKRTCYLRLNFQNFSIHDPVNGECKVDAFSAPQLTGTVPTLCGYNNQSHMYIYVKDMMVLQNVTLRFNLGEWRGPRHWMVNVAFIDCGMDWTPPARSCLQYIMSGRDSVRSFNFNELNPERSAMLAGLHYTVCIRQDPTKCATKWSSNFFQVSNSNRSTAIGDACQKSYVAISQGFNYLKQDKTYDRFCGERFGSENNSTNSSDVYSMAIPFNIMVKNSIDKKALGKGFYLNYTQVQCGGARSDEGVLSWLTSYLPNWITGAQTGERVDLHPRNATEVVVPSEKLETTTLAPGNVTIPEVSAAPKESEGAQAEEAEATKPAATEPEATKPEATKPEERRLCRPH